MKKDKEVIDKAATGLAGDKSTALIAGDNDEGKETVAIDPREKIAAIYDGTIESSIMLHKLANDLTLDVCVLQSPTVKFDKIKSFKKTYEIEGIGAHKKDEMLDYIKRCANYCLKQKIQKLYIPWTSDDLGIGGDKQSLFMNDIPTAFAELMEPQKDDENQTVIRPVFYWYGTATADIEKNKKQYGYE